MARFLKRRLLMTIPILLAVSIMVFAVVHLMPGDPARIMAGDGASEDDVEMVRVSLGLDKPLVTQYLIYMKNVLTGDLGKSLRTGRPVANEIGVRFPQTAKLAAMGATLATVVGVSVGILSASRPYSLADNVSMAVALVGVSAPSFYVGLMMMLLFAVKLQWIPLLADGTFRGTIIPAITLSARSIGLMARMTRSSMLEVLSQDHILASRAQGLTERVVLYSRALKNSMITILTIVGLQFGQLLAGAVIVETVFAYPGVGRLMVDSIKSRDYPTLQASVLLVAVSFVVINVITDILYTVINPRVRLS